MDKDKRRRKRRAEAPLPVPPPAMFGGLVATHPSARALGVGGLPMSPEAMEPATDPEDDGSGR